MAARTRYEAIRSRLMEAAVTKLRFYQAAAGQIDRIAGVVIRALKRDRSVYLFGNGGSAADAQHIACELEGRFYRNRRALPVLALTTNTSTLTAVANDLGYDASFSRQVEAHVRRGDVVIAISTSGKSRNVIAGAAAARRLGATVVGFVGATGGPLAKKCHLLLRAPSKDTPRIQECHITAGHILCEVVEAELAR